MHPAYSVILFSTATGAGYGLIAALALFALAAGIVPAGWFGVTAFLCALAMITFGLLASTFHLGHPERAWRAFSRWRTSWLSREGIASVVAYFPALAFAWGGIVEHSVKGPWLGVAAAAGALAMLTVYCTGMIYSNLRTVRAWCNPHTVPVYLVFAVWTGMLWFNFLSHAFGVFRPNSAMVFGIAGLATWFLKRRYWIFLDSTPIWIPVESATGLGALGKVRLLDPPNTEENFVQREMGYRVARRHATRLRIVAFVCYFVVPMAFGLGTIKAAPWLATLGGAIALVVGMFGTLIERWLFFAEAKHTAALYYGAEES